MINSIIKLMDYLVIGYKGFTDGEKEFLKKVNNLYKIINIFQEDEVRYSKGLPDYEACLNALKIDLSNMNINSARSFSELELLLDPDIPNGKETVFNDGRIKLSFTNYWTYEKGDLNLRIESYYPEPISTLKLRRISNNKVDIIYVSYDSDEYKVKTMQTDGNIK